jgi:hypothetical protein
MEYQIQLIKADGELSLEYTVKEAEIAEKTNRIINHKQRGEFRDITKMRIFAKTLKEEIMLEKLEAGN